VREQPVDEMVVHLGGEDEDDTEGEMDEDSSVQEQRDVRVTDASGDERCVVCERSEADDENAKWYGCDVCSMWYHAECLREEERVKAEESCRVKSKWICVFCNVTKYQRLPVSRACED
jgi:hypothetical protein